MRNARCDEQNVASDHLVEIPLEVALLHVDLLVGLDHVLQLLLSLLPLLELQRETENEKMRPKKRKKEKKRLDIHLLFLLLCQTSSLPQKIKKAEKKNRNFHCEIHQMCLLRNWLHNQQIEDAEILTPQHAHSELIPDLDKWINHVFNNLLKEKKNCQDVLLVLSSSHCDIIKGLNVTGSNNRIILDTSEGSDMQIE